MLRVIGVGDNVVDRYLHKKVMYPGGNCVNFAVYARQLGYESAYMGVLANDAEGILVRQSLMAEGVDVSMSPVIPGGETGRSTTRIVNGDRIITDDNDCGSVKATPLQLTPERLDHIRTFDLVHTSCYSFIDDQLPLIQSTGVPVLYDFSDEWDEAVLRRICPFAQIAFLSGKDLSEDDLKAYLKLAVSLGCFMAISTIGERGAIVYDGRRFYTKSPYNPDGLITDTLGAGDSFITGFITSYMQGRKIYRELSAQTPVQLTASDDEEDYFSSLILQSMCVGNLLARKTCMLPGAFGHEAAILD